MLSVGCLHMCSALVWFGINTLLGTVRRNAWCVELNVQKLLVGVGFEKEGEMIHADMPAELLDLKAMANTWVLYDSASGHYWG